MVRLGSCTIKYVRCSVGAAVLVGQLAATMRALEMMTTEEMSLTVKKRKRSMRMENLTLESELKRLSLIINRIESLNSK